MTETTTTLKKYSEYAWPHDEVLRGAGVDSKDLPKNLKQRYNAMKALGAAFDKSPSEKKLEGIKVASIKLADAIQDYIEKDLPSQPQDTSGAQPQPEVNVPGVINRGGDSELVNKIKEAITREKGRIYHADLKKILGQRELDDRVEVDGFMLERSWAFYYPKN